MLVETSLYDAAVVPLITHISSYLAQGGTLERSGNTAPGKVFSPYNCYAARDGYVLLLGAEGQKWQALCQLIETEVSWSLGRPASRRQLFPHGAVRRTAVMSDPHAGRCRAIGDAARLRTIERFSASQMIASYAALMKAVAATD